MAIIDPKTGYVQNETTNRWYKQPNTGTAPAPAAGSVPVGAGAATGSTTQPYTAPTTATTATPDEYWRDAKNLNRSTQQGGWSAGLDTLTRTLGGRGFRAGESGIADSAVGNFLSDSVSNMNQNATQLAVEGAKNKFLQNFSLDQFNEQKNQWGQEFGASREDQAMQDMMAYMKLMQDNQRDPYAAYWGGLNNAINS